ncbi:MAG: LacI family transcriptional regulator [Lachnospiraceae bacterium]|nr:LacI family transcriptional regulator [Lachnospiraceae bacterium]
MNIYDISKEAGVSIATVSRVLNGSSSVKPVTKKKVMDIIEKYGYTPNAFARGLGLNSMNAIGIICADCSDIYLAKAVYYIEGNLRAGGYNTILACSGYELEGKKSALNLLLNQRVDAVIMVGSNFVESEDGKNEYIREAAKQVPVLLLNADLDCPNVYCTMCDDSKATQEAATYLINSGKREILYLYNSKSYSAIKKLTGFQTALLVSGMDIDKNRVLYYDGSHEDIEGVCDFLCKTCSENKLSFDSVLAADDVLAIGATKYAKKMGLKVPEDIYIIGYNNSLLTACNEPELSSVDNHLETLCSQLVKTCIGTLNHEDIPQKIIFSGELIHRGTTKHI